MDDKKQSFLWAVQTMLLSEQIKKATDDEIVNSRRMELGIWNMHDLTISSAMRAVEEDLIPDDMTAFQAAYELVYRACELDGLPRWVQAEGLRTFDHPNLDALSDEEDARERKRQESETA